MLDTIVSIEGGSMVLERDNNLEKGELDFYPISATNRPYDLGKKVLHFFDSHMYGGGTVQEKKSLFRDCVIQDRA